MAAGDRCEVVTHVDYDGAPEHICREWFYRWGDVNGARTRMCTKHWWRWKRYGDPLTVHPRFVAVGETRTPRSRKVLLTTQRVEPDFAGQVDMAAVRAKMSRAAWIRRVLEAALVDCPVENGRLRR